MTVDGVTAVIVYDPDINYPLAMIRAIGSMRGWHWMTRSRSSCSERLRRRLVRADDLDTESPRPTAPLAYTHRSNETGRMTPWQPRPTTFGRCCAS
ncbi:MAG: hypothetical protein JZU52_17245 [Lamprocystis purpurea]|jgi:hypothetical protein|uniref:hypothetical protein n=1 Tax=Lamprocystis purpurea TaxID=61598 RepID=UPI00146D52FB|nr:hypothetical protein [Lamprocystis purpurea]MBV5275310.1 hypothetical protein [Lamprocystis purpurea]